MCKRQRCRVIGTSRRQALCRRVESLIRVQTLVILLKDDPCVASIIFKFLCTLEIEDLTQKTGNFKQFGVFVSMLKAAVARSSESVTLDLLTYADLEALRGQKFGHASYRGVSPAAKTSLGQQQQKQLQSKRYLILTYSVEFDRIHYPLALPYAGKLDPAVLLDTIRKLRMELQGQGRSRGRGHDTELMQLQQE